MLCNTVSTADFTLLGPGGSYIITNINGFGCSVEVKPEKTYTITFNSPITQTGNYQLCQNPASVASLVTNLCVNVAP